METAKINLNINGTLTPDNIKAAFKKQVRLLHEDKGGTGDIRRLIESRDFLLKNSMHVDGCSIMGCTESVAPSAGTKCDFHSKYA